MLVGIIRVESNKIDIAAAMAKGIIDNQSVAIYARTMIPYGDAEHMAEVVVPGMTQHHIDCMKDLGYDVILSSLSRQDKRKKFNKLSNKK